MLEKILLWAAVIMFVCLGFYSFYSLFKKYNDKDDPTLDILSYVSELWIFAIVFAIVDTLLEKFASSKWRIVIFKVFCFMWGVLMLLIAYIIYKLFEL